LTFTYRDATAVLGPLSTEKDPNGYDLCSAHADAVVPPRGWEVIRLAPEMELARRDEDEIMALADAVRERGVPRPGAQYPPMMEALAPRYGHLRVVPNTP
jgi:hypothetical protein